MLTAFDVVPVAMTGGDALDTVSLDAAQRADLDLRVSSVPDEPLDPLSKRCPEDLPCRVQDAELWFADAPDDLERAKSFCRQCPARMICLAGAVERREPWGVWGGEIFHRGAVVARKRPRGRPRKDAHPDVAA